MANNQALQILRASSEYDFKNSENRLLDGQLIYSKQNKQLYIGDTTNYEFKIGDNTYVNRLCDILPIGAANLVPTYSAGIRQLTSTKEDESYKVGKAAIALGNDTKAPGDYSLVFGKDSESSAQFTLAGGYNSKAKYYNSIAIGDNVTTSAANQIVFGSYNDNKSGALFIIGNGSFEDKRSNLLEFGSDSSTLYSKQLILKDSSANDYLNIVPAALNFTGEAVNTKSATITCNDIKFKSGSINVSGNENDGYYAGFYGDDSNCGITIMRDNEINFVSDSTSSDICFNKTRLGSTQIENFKFCKGSSEYSTIYAKDLIFNDTTTNMECNLTDIIGKIAIGDTYYTVAVSDDINSTGTDNVITLIVPPSTSNQGTEA